MTNIAVISASGKVGSLVAQKAKEKGFSVTAIVRNAARLTVSVDQVIEKDIFSLEKSDLAAFDVIVSAHGTAAGQETDYPKVAEHLVNLLKGTKTRLIVVGGAGSLYLDDTHTRRLVDELPTDLPYYPTVHEMSLANEIYMKSEANVTFFSPAEFFDPEGEETGRYVITENVLTKNKDGVSRVSYKDYATAVIEIIDQASHQFEHIGIYEN